jgi:hypothetical protein
MGELGACDVVPRDPALPGDSARKLGRREHAAAGPKDGTSLKDVTEVTSCTTQKCELGQGMVGGVTRSGLPS